MAQLAFSLEFPQRLHYIQKETYFQEKIITCLMNEGVKIASSFLDSPYLAEGLIGKVKPKLHTFRKVGARHLRPGDKLHPTVNSRTKNSFQFAPTQKLVSKEVVEIRRRMVKPGTDKINIAIGGHEFGEVTINGGQVTSIPREVEQMIYNDGFDSPRLFFEWFKASGIYECLHWTNLKYGEHEED